MKHVNFQARAKLPKKRRRVLPVEPTRGPRIPGPTGGPPGVTGDPNRNRLNANKPNNPRDLLGAPMPKIGEQHTIEK